MRKAEYEEIKKEGMNKHGQTSFMRYTEVICKLYLASRRLSNQMRQWGIVRDSQYSLVYYLINSLIAE